MPAGLTPEREPRTLIGRVLINAGYVTLDQLAEGLAKQFVNPGKRLGELLVELGYLSPARLEKGLAMQALEREITQRTSGPLEGK